MLFINKINQMYNSIQAISKRVAILECSHDSKYLIIEDIIFYDTFSKYIGRKYCRNCGKTFKYYTDKKVLLKERNQLMRELIELNEKEIKNAIQTT